MKVRLIGILAAGLGIALAASAQTKGDEEFAASFEVRPDAIVDGAPMGFGFSLKANPRYAEGPLDFKIDAGPVVIGPKELVSGFDTAFRTGLWHHVAVAYRQKGNTAHVWVDGELVGVGHTETQTPPPAQAFLDAPKARDDFPGEIRNVRIWKSIPADGELLPESVLEPIRRANLAHEASLVPGYEGRDPVSGILPFAIDRHGREKHVPFRTPSDAKALKEVRMAAAQGEIEDASFVLLPFRDFTDVDVSVTDLKGPAGTVPATCFDVRLVKCWLQCRGGWCNFYTQGQNYPTLTPELLVHDDRLMTVDPKTHRNMLRISYPDGEASVSVSTPEDTKLTTGFNFNLEPVQDAAKLVPFSLKAGRSRQLWLTLRCPEEKKDGVYRGAVTVCSGGKTLCEIPLVLTVHPFRLPLAHCHHEPERPFLATWMWHGNLSDKLSGYGGPGGNLEKAELRFYAELRNMAEHNCGYPWALVPPPSASNILDFASLQLEFMKQAGCEMRPLFGGIGAGGDLAYRASSDQSALDMTLEKSRQDFAAEMNGYTNSLRRLTSFVEEKVGHREIVYYALDEAKADYIRRSFPSFAALNYFGGISFTTTGDAASAAFMTDFNDMPGGFDLVKGVARFNRKEIRKWHASGARVFCYGSPHSGPECPDIWRRDKGLGAYFSNLDGVNEYIWYEAAHIWNDFIYNSGYRNFCMVYPTADGVIDTVQWEAEREGLDDIRYFSYLNRLAAIALDASDAALVNEGRRAVQWMELVDWEGGDLDAFRLEAARRIVTLTEALSRAGLDKKLALDYPSRPQAFSAILPEPQADAKAAALCAQADAYAKVGACDIAVRFYTKAAEKDEDRESRQKVWTAAGDAALAYRDVQQARECYQRAEANVKIAQLALWPDRIGWKPSEKELQKVERTIWSHGDATSKIMFLNALHEAGQTDRALTLAMQMHDSVEHSKAPGAGEIRTQTARLAASILEARGEMRKASIWYQNASVDEWPPCSKMMYQAAECARKAKDYTRAIDCYTKVMSNLTGEAAGARKPLEERVREISALLRNDLKKEDEYDDGGLTLDE